MVAQAARGVIFRVLAQRTVYRLESFRDLLQKGTREDIIRFMETRNLENAQIFSF